MAHSTTGKDSYAFAGGAEVDAKSKSPLVGPGQGGCQRTQRRAWADIDVHDVDLDEDILEELKRTSRPTWADYPVTPTRADSDGADTTDGVFVGDARIGLDIVGVITKSAASDADVLSEWGVDHEAPGAFDALRRLVDLFGQDNVFIVGRARHGSLLHRKTEHWLHETCSFCKRTGVLRNNIVFYSAVDGELDDGEGAIVRQLRLTHLVASTLNFLSALVDAELVASHNGLLLHLAMAEGSVPAGPVEQVQSEMRPFYRRVGTWQEALRALDDAGLHRRTQSSSISSAAGGASAAPWAPSVVAFCSAAPPAFGTDADADARRSGYVGTESSQGGEGSSLRSKRRGTRGGAKNRLGVARHGAGSGGDSGALSHAPATQGVPFRAAPRLQLKPRSTDLGEIGSQAQVSGKQSAVFGR